MKYFRVVNPDDVTEEFYVSCSQDCTPEEAKKILCLSSYWMTECSKEEFETMTQDVNDYIINVGHEKDNLSPFASAHDWDEGMEKAKELLSTWEYVELVFMPQDNVDINEVVWKNF